METSDVFGRFGRPLAYEGLAGPVISNLGTTHWRDDLEGPLYLPYGEPNVYILIIKFYDLDVLLCLKPVLVEKTSLSSDCTSL